MLNKIFVLTYGRAKSQVTWNNLPDIWKEKASLVVQEREKHLYDGYPIVVLPDNVRNLPATIEWVVKNNRDIRFGMFDDDLSFYRTRMTGETWEGTKRKMIVQDFIDLEETVCAWMDEGIVQCGMEVAWNIPDRDNEYKEITRICANFFYDGPKVPADEIDWTGSMYAENFHLIIQLLKKGYKNRISNRFRIDTIATQSEGGCAVERTVERHNDSMRALAEMHPGIVKLYEKETTGGQWAGTPKLAAKIAWKEAYKRSQVNSLDSFF